MILPPNTYLKVYSGRKATWARVISSTGKVVPGWSRLQLRYAATPGWRPPKLYKLGRFTRIEVEPPLEWTRFPKLDGAERTRCERFYVLPLADGDWAAHVRVPVAEGSARIIGCAPTIVEARRRLNEIRDKPDRLELAKTIGGFGEGEEPDPATHPELRNACLICGGWGVMAQTERAMHEPERYPDELVECPDCAGRGGESRACRELLERWEAHILIEEATEPV